MSKEAMKLAIEALKYIDDNYMSLPKVGNEATKALEEALAKQEQGEPVAYGMRDTMIGNGNRMMYVRLDKGQDGCTVPLYTTPQPKQEQELDPVHEYRKGFIAGQIDMRDRQEEQGEPVAGQGAELYKQMIEAIQKLLTASKEPSRWGAVGPDAEDIAWGQVTALLTHICVGIDSPQPKQEQGEPVAWMHKRSGRLIGHKPYGSIDEWDALYTTPQQRAWVGLDEEDDINWEEGGSLRDLVEAVEAKLKEKNT